VLLTNNSAAYLKEVLRSTQPVFTYCPLQRHRPPCYRSTPRRQPTATISLCLDEGTCLTETRFASRACPVIKHWRKAGPETFRGKEPRNPEEAAVAGTQYTQHVVAGTLANRIRTPTTACCLRACSLGSHTRKTTGSDALPRPRDASRLLLPRLDRVGRFVAAFLSVTIPKLWPEPRLQRAEAGELLPSMNMQGQQNSAGMCAALVPDSSAQVKSEEQMHSSFHAEKPGSTARDTQQADLLQVSCGFLTCVEPQASNLL